MKTLALKSWPEFFEPVFAGIKTFELRRNDRHFEVGDIVVLNEWEPGNGERISRYTGRTCTREIAYVLNGLGHQGVIEPLKGLMRGYCILGFKPPEDEERSWPSKALLLRAFANKVLNDDLSWPEMQECHNLMHETAEILDGFVSGERGRDV